MGKINPGTLLAVLGLTIVGWLGYHIAPLYLDHVEVREAVSQISNLVPTVDDPMNAATQPFFNLNARVGWHYEIDEETGLESIVPGLGLTLEDNLTIDVDPETKITTVRLEYDRTVQLKPLQRRYTKHFVATSKTKRR